MIQFYVSNRKKDGTPVVTDLYIQEFAEAVLRDYNPKLLREPGKINAEHFLESYLGATIDYKDIYYEEGTPPVAGATIFNSGLVPVFNRERMRVEEVFEKANTVLIDNATMKPGKEGFALFTHLHEAGHLMMHQEVYRVDRNQISLFSDDEDWQDQQRVAARAVTCKRCMIEAQPKTRLLTDEDFREHQSNTFAAATSMPRPTFIPCARELLRSVGYKDGVFIDYGSHMPGDAERLLHVIGRLAGIYGVSRSAARIQLERQKLLRHDNTLRRLDDADYSFGLGEVYD